MPVITGQPNLARIKKRIAKDMNIQNNSPESGIIRSITADRLKGYQKTDNDGKKGNPFHQSPNDDHRHTNIVRSFGLTGSLESELPMRLIPIAAPTTTIAAARAAPILAKSALATVACNIVKSNMIIKIN
jgi:hypothetical protein